MAPRPTSPVPARLLACALLAFALSAAAAPRAHGGDAATQHAAVAPVASIADGAQPAVAVVDAFGAALQAGDFARMRELLGDDVLVLESGGAERSEAEYFAEHAAADADFLRGAHVRVTHRTARVHGDFAWVGTESEIHASKDGSPLTLLGSETMLLARTPDGWRIVHIHWSSRKRE